MAPRFVTARYQLHLESLSSVRLSRRPSNTELADMTFQSRPAIRTNHPSDEHEAS